jgi:hypothetical protein
MIDFLDFEPVLRCRLWDNIQNSRHLTSAGSISGIRHNNGKVAMKSNMAMQNGAGSGKKVDWMRHYITSMRDGPDVMFLSKSGAVLPFCASWDHGKRRARSLW